MKPDHKRMKLVIEDWEDEDGNCMTLEIPAHYGVCDRCNGKGVHDHEAFSNGFCGNEEWCDSDFLEDYHAGVYDVQCEECDGRRVVLVPTEEKLTDEMRDAIDDYHEARIMDAHEARMRARGIQW